MLLRLFLLRFSLDWIEVGKSLWDNFTDCESNWILWSVWILFLEVFHLFFELGHFLEHFVVCFFLSIDDTIASFKLRLGNFQVFSILIFIFLTWGTWYCWESGKRSSFINLSLDDNLSVLFSFVLLSSKLFLKALSNYTIIFFRSSFDSFSNLFIDDFLLSLLSFS